MSDLRFPGPLWGPHRVPVRLIHQGTWSDTVEAACGDGATRRLAIKLAEVAGHEERVERWMAAAVDVSRALTHPHIAPLFEVRVHEGWMVADRHYLSGVDLGSALRTGHGASPDVVCAIGCALFDALSAAHAVGVVAAHVSPSHVISGRDGNVQLLHVGMPAAPNRPDPGRSPSAHPETAYAPPEAFTGGGVSAPGDVYSAAALTHALVHGHPPAPEGHRLARVLVRKGALAMDASTDVMPAIPELSPVLRAALAVQPEDRPSAAAVAAALAPHAESPPAIAAWTRTVVGTASIIPPV